MSNYYDERANQLGRDLSNIELNGGMGSGAWWDAHYQQQAARQQSESWNRAQQPPPWQTTPPVFTLPPVAYVPTGTTGRATQRPKPRAPTPPGGSLFTGLVKLSLIGVWFWLAWWVWQTGHDLLPRTPTGSYLFRPLLGTRLTGDRRDIQETRRLKASDFEYRYGALFKPNTPWIKALPACPNNTRDWRCAYPTYATVSALAKAYALQPGRFWEDFCHASLEPSFGPYWLLDRVPALRPLLALPVAPVWTVRDTPAGQRYLGTHQCVLRNATEMEQAVQDVRGPFMTGVQTLSALLLLMALPTFWLLRQRPVTAPEKRPT